MQRDVLSGKPPLNTEKVVARDFGFLGAVFGLEEQPEFVGSAVPDRAHFLVRPPREATPLASAARNSAVMRYEIRQLTEAENSPTTAVEQ